MEVTYRVIEKACETAVEVLKDVYPAFNAPSIDQVKISNKMTCAWMTISKTGLKGHYILKVSKQLFETITDSAKFENALESTAIHEYIHTIPGCFNHGAKFKVICSLVREGYGYDTNTKNSALARGGHSLRRNIVGYIVCETCGRKYPRRKRVGANLKFQLEMGMCRCGYCNSRKLSYRPEPVCESNKAFQQVEREVASKDE